MSNFIDSLQTLQGMISATVYFENTGSYDNETPLPLYEIDIRSIREQYIGPVESKVATIQIKYHEQVSNNYVTLSAFAGKYELDKSLRALVKDWHKEIQQVQKIPGIKTLTNIQTVLFDDLVHSEFGTKTVRRVAVQFDFEYTEV